MTDNIFNIGSAPKYRGVYNNQNTYYEQNIVTMCSCIFSCTANEQQGIPPLVVANANTGTMIFANTDVWVCIMDNLELYNKTQAAIAAMALAESLNVEMAAAIANCNHAKDECRTQTENYVLAYHQVREAIAQSNVATEAVYHALDGLDEFKKTVNGEPLIMKLEYLDEISIRNKVRQQIKVKLLPNWCSQSALFNIYDGATIDVDPDGYIERTDEIGENIVEVIPPGNTRLWKRFTIIIRNPKLVINGSKVRLANGTIRIV